MSEKKKPKQSSLAPFLAQLQKDMQAYQKFVAPTEQFQKSITKAVQPLIDAQNTWAKQAIELNKQMAAAAEPLRKIQEQITKDFSQVISQISKFQIDMKSLMKPFIETISETFKKLPAKMKKALKTLGEHGWFLDLEMPMPGIWQLEEAMNDGNIKEAEDALINYFRKRTSEIEGDLCNQFPNRAKILHAAFKAHSRGEYELSIPVLLAQADGICNEITGIQLYQKRNRVPATAVYVQQLANDTFRAAILHPLSLALPISASEKERGENFNDLNRHQVLHGESTAYGSEINSLKAISLLNYVAQVLAKSKDGDKKD